MKIYLSMSKVSLHGITILTLLTDPSFSNVFLALGVLETSAEDFESGDDIFEAIGGVLQEVANEKSEDDIKELCDQLLHTLNPLSNGNANNSGRKLLDAPVHLGATVATNAIDENLGSNMWIQKVEDNLVSALCFFSKKPTYREHVYFLGK